MKKHYKEITDLFIKKLKEGVIPWKHYLIGGQRNIISKKKYQGINSIMLSMSNFSSPVWMTFNQAKSLGGSVKKGEKGTPILFFKMIKDKKDKDKEYPVIKRTSVFNIEQVKDIEKDANIDIKSEKRDPIKTCEEILKNTSIAKIEKRPYRTGAYNLSEDIIYAPDISQCVSSEEYYSMLFHEAVHSTGHKKRLNRKFDLNKKSDIYKQEELIAEIGAGMICSEAGILNETINNSASYISNWIRSLEKDEKLIVKAASQAEKAAEFILNTKEN